MSHDRIYRVGTRGSLLALAQAGQVVEELKAGNPGVRFEMIVIKTKGDQVQDVPLVKIGDKGLFTREIEQALLRGEVDLAIHSLKDLPGDLPEGLEIGAVPVRAEARDAFLSVRFESLAALPPGAVIGTGSLRRRAQLLHRRPGQVVEDLRGNVDTRLRKLREGRYDAIILAAAGLARLGLAGSITALIPLEDMLPAVGQGALALEKRSGDSAVADVLRVVHHPPSALAVEAERGFLKEAEAGCQVPLAAHATLAGDEIRVSGVIAALDGSRLWRDMVSGPAVAGRVEKMGRELARRLLDAGGEEILREIRRG